MDTYQNPITGTYHALDLENPKPGIYAGVSHFDYLKIKAVSRSDLVRFRRSVEDFLWPQEQQNTSTVFGTLYHAYMLEPDKFKEEFHERPPDLRVLKKEEKEAYKADVERYGIDRFYTVKDIGTLEEMRAAFDRYPLNKKTLFGGTFPHELTVIFTHPGTGIVCKIRIDRLVEKASRMIDLKSAHDPLAYGFRTSLRKFGSDLQPGFYVTGCSNTEGLRHVELFSVMAQEKTPPYKVRQWDMDEYVAEGIIETDKQLRDLKKWIDEGKPIPDGMQRLIKYF